MSSVPSCNKSITAESRPADRRPYIVIDHADGPGTTHRLAEVAEWFRATCAADDRPCAIAILGPRKAEVVLDMATCSWKLCGACVARLRAMIANYPDGPTQTLRMGPALIRVCGLTPHGAPILARELIADAIDCRMRHGRTAGGKWAPRRSDASRSASPKTSKA